MTSSGGSGTVLHGPTASRVLSFVGLLGMLLAIGYGAVQVRALDADYLVKVDSLSTLGAQADSLRTEVNRIRSGPLESLVTPKIVAVPAGRVSCPKAWDGYGGDSHGLCPGYGFLLWLDVPFARRADIREVEYHFTGITTSPVRTGSEPSNSFLVGWLGFYPWSTIPVVIVPKVGPRITLEFAMEQSLRDAGWSEGK